MEKVMRKTMGTNEQRGYQEQQVGRCPSRAVLVWVGEMIEVEREVRRVRQVRVSSVIVRTLAFIWSDVNSQFCSRQGILSDSHFNRLTLAAMSTIV